MRKPCHSLFSLPPTGSVNLPPVAAMQKDIDDKKEKLSKR